VTHDTAWFRLAREWMLGGGPVSWAILAAVVLGSVLLVAAPFYISVIPPGPEGASAHHPQGRYLLPLGPAALLLLCNRRWALDWNARRQALAGWTALVLAVSVASVAARYYF
jgi:hypothetical protein